MLHKTLGLHLNGKKQKMGDEGLDLKNNNNFT